MKQNTDLVPFDSILQDVGEDKKLKESAIKQFKEECAPNARDMLAKNILVYQELMNNSERLNKKKKAKILNRVVQAK